MFKHIHRYIRGRWERYYLKSHWHLVLDLSLSLIIIILAAAVVSLYFYRPNLPWFGQHTAPIVDLNNPPLELTYNLNSSSTKIKEGITLKIDFKNNGTAAVNDVSINLLTTDSNFTVSRLETADTALKINGREVVLTRIEAGGSGEATLRVYFNQKNPVMRTINWQAQNQYFFAGHLLKATVNLPALTIPATLEAKEAIYYTSPQGDQLGVGPLPPLVGIPTSYWVFWEVSSANDFKNLVFSARLPKGIELSGGRSLLSGEFNYNTSSRQVIWKIPELKGQDNNYRIGFEIQLIPTPEQVGHILPLLSNSYYYGQDPLTGEKISGSLNQLTTNLETDSFNVGQGEVANP